MPCLRGIEISFSSEVTGEPFPEFPHPEGSSVQLLGRYNLQKHRLSTANLTPNSSAGSLCGSAQPQKTRPTISIYIPSIPGTPFSVKYAITQLPPPPCKLFFFRLLMNGRDVASWGIDLEDQRRGKIAKTLWAPCSQYDGRVGLEQRSFVFLAGQERKSVAEDGGLIQIQVFRARERYSRAPCLEEFRNHNNYGIAIPSVGLMSDPEDALYYSFHLMDAKDEPYATFKYHYRSWDNLEQLNIIPPAELQHLRSTLSFESISETMSGEDLDSQRSDEEPSSHVEYLDECVFNENQGQDEEDSIATSDQFQVPFPLQTPPELFSMPSTATLKMPQPSKVIRDKFTESYLHRPLPELPKDELEPSFALRRTSEASALSGVPSVTPSLVPYINQECIEDDEVEIGMAQPLHMARIDSASRIMLEETGIEDPAEHSFSDYNMSLPSTNDSAPLRPKTVSPSKYRPTTGSSFEYHLDQLTPTRDSTSSRSNRENIMCYGYESDMGQISVAKPRLTESEWMRRTPSPVKRTDDNTDFDMWSPRPQRRSLWPIGSPLKSPKRCSPTKWSPAKSFFSSLHRSKTSASKSADISNVKKGVLRKKVPESVLQSHL
ncbi:hypothetical protein QBC46DRAFT_303903 [Diplogelasinospora grovesii]|uniref:Uncharacterized protein n=1 Tax=Diplogelasinospora grovesii TaxID=303347 RepID=A0AAN6S8M6_9PEZI|nr:hypothetical protein QBC46DRAFT_303903 [Diplogelasinospora grovesii]